MALISQRKAQRSRYVTAGLLQGKSIPVTINYVREEEMYNRQSNRKENKLVLYFKGKDKGLILNATNEDMLASLFGDNTDTWAGNEITIYPNRETVGGRTMDVIRIKETMQAPQSPGETMQTGGMRGMPVNEPLPDEPPVDMDEMDKRIEDQF